MALTRELTRFLEVEPDRGTWKRSLHSLVVATVTLVGLSLAFGIPAAMVGVPGLFLATAAYERSLRSRARVLRRLALAYLVAVSLGALASLLPAWQAVLVLAALGTAISFGYHALLSDPPGPMMLILGAAVATYVPTLGVPIPLVIAVTALGLALGCSTSLLLTMPHSRAAVRRQLEALQEAVDAFDTDLSELPADEVGRLRDEAFGALFAAQASLRSSSSRREGAEFSPEHLRMEDEIHALHLRLLRKMVAEDLPWAQAGETSMLDHYVGAPRESYLVQWAFSRASPAWLAARRTGAAILAAGETSVLLGSDHPYWSVMTAALVLSVPADRISTLRRAGHRVVGTGLGVVLFLGIYSLHPPAWVTAGIVVVCLALLPVLAPQQYLLAMTMTPIPLLLAAMHAQTGIAQIIQSRILETVIGAVAALLVLWLPGRSSSVLLVRRQFRRAMLALDQVLRQMVINPSPDAGIELRRNLHFEQLAAARTLAMVLNDHPETLEGWSEVEAALNELTYSVLTAARTTDPGRALNWLEMARALETFLRTLPPVSKAPLHASVIAVVLTDVRLSGRPR